MAETAFLEAVAAYLGALPLPGGAAASVAEPDKNADLPCVVLSLESTVRLGPGIGERAELVKAGALAWRARIDLANPFLPGDTTSRLIDDSRKQLILPHGGLVKSDGTGGALVSPADIEIKVLGTLRPLVASAPTGNQYSVNRLAGMLLFGTALPGAGAVDARYFIGQWERRVERIRGVLRLDACAGDAAVAQGLSTAAVGALVSDRPTGAIPGLLEIGVAALSSVGTKEQGLQVRRRVARLSFLFDHVIDRPDSSGGIIREIPIFTRLGVAKVDPATSAIDVQIMEVNG